MSLVDRSERGLPPIGDYDLRATHVSVTHEGYFPEGQDDLSDEEAPVVIAPKDVAHIFCTSKVSPVTMSINYPNPIGAEAGLIDHETYYVLRWPSQPSSKAEVAEAIQRIGETQVDGGYTWGSDFFSPVESSPSELIEAANFKADIGSTLEQAMFDGFGRLQVVSSKVLVGWSAREVKANPDGGSFERGGFSLKAGDDSPVTEPFVREIIEQTIITEHIGKVVVALETLGAIFEQYKDQNPTSFME